MVVRLSAKCIPFRKGKRCRRLTGGHSFDRKRIVKVRTCFIWSCFLGLAGGQLFGAGELGSDGDNLEEGLAEEAQVVERAGLVSRGGPPGVRSFYSITVDALYFSKADIRGGSAEVSEKAAGIELGWTRVAAFNDFTQLTTSYTRKEYNVEQSDRLEESLTEVNALRIGGTLQRPFGDRWSGFATSRLSLQAAKGTPLSNGWNVPFSAGIGYLINPQLNVSVGVLGTWEAQLGTRVIPIAAIRWMPTDRLTIMTLNGVRVSYKMGERKEWELLSSVMYETFVFAVTDLEGFDEEQGVVSQEYFQAQIGLNKSFGPKFQIGVFLESRFEREFEYYKNEKKFAEFDVDSSLGFRLAGTYRF